MKPLRLTFRGGVCLVLCGAAFFCGGCVYLRLLQLKNQLVDFDHHFVILTDDGVKLRCLHPLLLGDDLRWLGVEPRDIEQVGEVERWHVRWIKDEPTTSPDKTIHDVELYAELKDEKLQQLDIPERYFAFFPKALFVDLLRSTGKATIDKLTRQAEISTGNEVAGTAAALPALGSVEQMLGVPTEQGHDAGFVRYRYRYRTQTPTGRGKAIEMIFFFDQKNGELRRLIGKLPKGTLNFNFPATPEKAPSP